MIPLGDWVLRQACQEAANWPIDVKVAVNLSPVQLKSRNLTEAVINALKESGVAANRLQLEITETDLMQSTFNTLTTLQKLRTLGVQIALDDFGTGYSSLSYCVAFRSIRSKLTGPSSRICQMEPSRLRSCTRSPALRKISK
jgi:EAL domain-containing protein (putative c-di-GMP-specific phosphodiesterase class I)